jgi:myo-inositol 2-dehydrogenase/D-chiro-inositol 1-dehydrogenase
MMRFDPRYRAIAEAVHAGRLGRPIQLTMRGNVPDFEGRALAGRVTLAVENLVHAFDLWAWIVGPIVRVHGEASATEALGPGIVDSIVVTVRFASGAVGTLASAWNMPSGLGYASESFFSLLGSEGLAWVDGRDSGTGIVGPGTTSFPSTVAWVDPSGVPYGLYRTEIEHFLASVRDGRPWPVSLSEARAAVAVALAVDRSIATGLPVELGA